MTTEVQNRHLIQKPTPIIWAHVIKARPARSVKGVDYKSQYEVTFLFDPTDPDFSAIKALAGQVAHATFGRTDNLGYKFLENGTKLADEAKAKGKDREFLRGKIMFSPHSNAFLKDGGQARPPKLIVNNNGQWSEYADEYERTKAGAFFYNGVECRGEVSFSSYTGMGGGVTCYLNELLSTNKGTRINAGSGDVESKYGSATQYMGTVSSVDPTAGMTADITF